MEDVILIIHGILVAIQSGASTAGYAIEVKLRTLIGSEKTDSGTEDFFAPVSASTRADTDGSFRIELDIDGEPQGPVEIVVSAPNGTEVARREITLDQAQKPVKIEVRTVAPFRVAPSDDPTIGRRLRVSGQVVDAHGRSVASGLPVVIWGVPLDEAGGGPDARPLLVAETQTDGKFAGEWPTTPLKRAFGSVSGGPPVAVALDENNRLTRNILLVIDLDDIEASDEDKDGSCACDDRPPRAPDPLDLTANPSAFSQDLGGTCVDLTVPNRTLEEFSYFMVVRTSEPKVRGVTLGLRRRVPTHLLVDLLGVSIASTAFDRNNARAATVPISPISLDVHAAKALVRGDRPPSVSQVERAAWLSELNYTRTLIDAGLRESTGRSVLDADHAIDWDETPRIHLAMDIAHGHILRYREVWRADGYSLGDLLYSLPLAPGQRRQIAVVDWDRRSASAREEQLEFEEELDALLTRDRDVQEIVGTQLHEETSAGSRNTTWGAAGGIGAGFISSGFGIFGGVAGGGGGSDSNSWQRSARRFSADSLQRLRDRVGQRSSSVRDQRSTVVQSVAQGETLRAETEVVANYNHCHAITIEYFEVLRHFLITHELADVEECLFVPLPISEFDRGKALRWREPLSRYLKQRNLRIGFSSIERIADNWVGWDYPETSYSEEAPNTLEGELRISFLLPRPRDGEDGKYQVDMWEPLSFFLPVNTFELFTARLNALAARERDQVFRQEVAPEIAKNLVQRLRFAYVGIDGGETEVPLDATLVSRYRESQPLYISLNPAGDLPNVPREDIAHFKIWYDGPPLSPDAQVIVHRGRMRYRTEHLTALLFNDRRILDDIRTGDAVVIPTPVSRREMRNPRQEDMDRADRLVAHLNEHLEYYHQAIWVSLDAQRRYMLLDAVLVPGLEGKSIASVCTNELIGIVGNSMVLPVAPGQRLDPTLDATDDEGRPVDLANAYATPPAPPLRVSVPTRGVYAEAISGECNACEAIDDTRYWRWTTEGQLALPGLETVGTGTRATDEPDLTPAELPKPLVSIQNAPEIPDPFGLGGAFELLSKPELFRDITGLEGTQRNARAAFEAALSAASAIGGEAAQLARQQELGRNTERMLDRINSARNDGLLSQETAQELAASALGGLVGDKQTKPEQPTQDETVEKVLDQTAQSSNAEIKVSTPDETVEISFNDDEPVVGAASSIGRLDVKDFINQDIVVDVFGGAPGARTLTFRRIDTLAKLKVALGGGFPLWKGQGFVRENPADATKFQVSRRLRIVHPAPTGKPNKVAGKGRLPVVVLVHGQHESWSVGGEVLNHEGYTYLQEELARQNIVSISVDTNAANATGSFIEMRAEMTLGGIDALRAMDGDKASRFHQRLDLDNVVLVGHSRGGDAVIRAAQLNAPRPAATKIGVKAVLALAPTDFTGTTVAAQVRSMTPAETPFLAVMYGGLDGDVAGFEGADSFVGTGFRHYDRAACDKAMLFVDHCNHNRFNSVWTADDFFMMPDDVAAGSRLLTRADHEKLAKEVIGGLALWKLLGQSKPRGLFDGSTANSVGAGVSLQWSFGNSKLVIDQMESKAGSLLGTRTLFNADVEKFHQITIGARALNAETNHTTGVLLVDSNIAGPSPAALEIAIDPADQDWSNFDSLLVSVGALYDLTDNAAILAGPLPSFDIVISDQAGVSSVLQSSTLSVGVAPRRPVFHETQFQPMGLASSSVANPTLITMANDRVGNPMEHKLTTGDEILISGHTGSVPAINGRHQITRLSNSTFTIPVNVTTAGSGGRLRKIENCTALRLETMEVQFAAIRFNPAGVDLTQIKSVSIHPPAAFASEMFFDALQLIAI